VHTYPYIKKNQSSLDYLNISSLNAKITKIIYEPALFNPRITRLWEFKNNKKWNKLKTVSERKLANAQMKEILKN